MAEEVEEKLDDYLGFKTSSTQVQKVEDEATRDRRSKSDISRILLDEALEARARARQS